MSIPLWWKRCSKWELTCRNAKPQKLTAELAQGAEMLITMGCGDDCPYVPGLRRDDWPLPDPKGQGIASVRQTRDEIKRRVLQLLEQSG